ncbi:MAG: hypothetical protein IPK70_17530 [Flavobacteriales bacterium]|nr:hypothetical protein [Flavobacteriales bacterium]
MSNSAPRPGRLPERLWHHSQYAGLPGHRNTSTSNTLQHLPLGVGIAFAPALLYNESAIAQAVSDYNGTYNLAYFSPTLNGRLAELNRKWDNTNWRVDTVQGQ